MSEVKDLFRSASAKAKNAEYRNSNSKRLIDTFLDDELISAGPFFVVEKPHNSAVRCIHQLEDNALVSVAEDTLKIWHTSTGKLLKQVKWICYSSVQLRGDLMASSIKDKNENYCVSIWNIKTNKCLKEMPTRVRCGCLLTIKRNRSLVCGLSDGRILCFDSSTMKHLQTLISDGEIYCLCSLADGRLVSGGNSGTVDIWPIRKRKRKFQTTRRRMLGHNSFVWKLVELSNRVLASASDDTTIRIWNLTLGSCIRVLQGHSELVTITALSDGNLASGSLDGTLKVWDCITGECILTRFAYRRVFSIEEMDDGSIVTGGSNGEMAFWKTRNRLLVLNC